MRWTLRCAVLLAALVLALGTVGVMRPDVAAANEDVELLDPPGRERGDPDDGGGARFSVFGWGSWLGSAKQSLVRLKDFAARQSMRPSSASNPKLRQPWTWRR